MDQEIIKKLDQKQTNKLTIEENINVKGLYVCQNFISKEEEIQLLKEIKSQEWNTQLKRRTQHYGYIYDYTSKTIDESSYLGPLPSFCQIFVDRMLENQIIDEEPDQLIINEYEPGQGINSHIDKIDFFKENIISISLGSQCIMEFTRQSQNKEQELQEISLPRRSLIKLSKEARYQWKHGIKSRKTDIIEGAKQQRDLRISLTFRNISRKQIKSNE